MIFPSYEFLFLYAPVTFAVFYLLAKARAPYALWFLVAASLVFYWRWDGPWKIILPISIVTNYAFSLLIGASTTRWMRYAALTVAVATNLATLLYFKYAPFLAEVFTGQDRGLVIALPLGISFYTFTQIAFLVDSAREKQHDVGLRDYGLFVSFFPHLIAGPIIHHRNVIPQFRSIGQPVDWSRMEAGLFLFALGLVKKSFLADNIAPFASHCYAAGYLDIAQSDACMCALSYSFQLYFDFSGYSDMAIGLSLLLGISIPINFASPYRSRNITEFWRRWHISLSSFLRDYLYIPLGGNKLGRAAQYRNMFVVMVLGGAWHGSGWTFVAWGAWHGALLVAHRAWQDAGKRFRLVPVPAILGVIITFLAVTAGWILFRSPGLDHAMAMFRGLAGYGPAADPQVTLRGGTPGPINSLLLQSHSRYAVASLWIALAAGIAFFCPNSQWLTERFLRVSSAPRRRLATIALGLFGTAAIAGAPEFIYFNF